MKFPFVFLFQLLVNSLCAQINDLYTTSCSDSREGAGYFVPLTVSEVNNAESQIVTLIIDSGYQMYSLYKAGKSTKDLLEKYHNRHYLDTVSVAKWEKESLVSILIQRQNVNVYKVVPDLNRSGVFTDDKAFYWKSDSTSNKWDNYLSIPYEVEYWASGSFKAKMQLIVYPDADFLPRKYPGALYNTYGGVKRIKQGKILVGADSFLVRLFPEWGGHLLFTKQNTVFYFSKPNENFFDLTKPDDYPFYTANDSLFFNDKVLMLDSVSVEGDYLVFRSVAENERNRGVRKGDFVQSIMGPEVKSKKMREIDFSKEKKYWLLHFWGSWCSPCIKNMPQLRKLYEQSNKSAIEFVGVDLEQNSSTVNAENIINRYQLNWHHFLQVKSSPFIGADIVDWFKVFSYPTYVLINSQGVIELRTVSLNDMNIYLMEKGLVNAL